MYTSSNYFSVLILYIQTLTSVSGGETEVTSQKEDKKYCILIVSWFWVGTEKVASAFTELGGRARLLFIGVSKNLQITFTFESKISKRLYPFNEKMRLKWS